MYDFLQEEHYDLLILGAGPAGLAAGMYGARAKLKTGIIEKALKVGGQAASTEELENYPGFGPGTSGKQLSQAMLEHALAFGAELIQDEVTGLELNNSSKEIICKNKKYIAKALICALGAQPRLLNISGEQRLRGKGVSYCATCDADFFEDLEVVVVGSGDAAIEEAEYLSKFASKVTILVVHDEGKVDASRRSAERAFKNPKIEWLWNIQVVSINGKEIVESVSLKNIKNGKEFDYTCNGIFIFIGTQANTNILKGKIALNHEGYIITCEKMATTLEGVFAAGDIREKYLRQVVTATADGAIAAIAADKYIHELELWQSEVINAKKPVLIAYYHPQELKKTEEIMLVDTFVRKHNDKLSLVKIDISRNELIEKRYGINKKSLPLVHLFKKGELVESINEININNLVKLCDIKEAVYH